MPKRYDNRTVSEIIASHSGGAIQSCTVIQWPNFEILASLRAVDCRDGLSVLGSGGHGHEIVFKLCRALGCRCLVDFVAERYGSVTNRNRLSHPSYRHGRSAEAIGEATSAEAGRKQCCISPDDTRRSRVRSSTRTKAVGCAKFNIGEACRA